MTLALLDGVAAPLFVDREPQGLARSENDLRDLVFAWPQMLPLHEIDPGFGRIISVAKELVIPDVGRIDALLVDERGKLIVIEAKLWRNPQARREVVGQILDYARELARFSYEDLQRQISIATKRTGNVLYELAREAGSLVDEARFVDQVSRDLKAGRFLLLIVGDGITEGTHRIGEFLSSHAGLAFDFGMVEVAHYRFVDPATGMERSIVQPRLIARTVLIERGIIRNEAADVRIAMPEEIEPPSATGSGEVRPAMQQWRAFAERFLADMRFDDPAQPAPRIGGVNWMSAPLPGKSSVTLWRSKDGVVGAFARGRNSEGLADFDSLAADRPAIDQEFAEAGLLPPEWTSDEGKASIALEWPSPLPWDEAEEARQMVLFSAAANQFVNSLRPRLARRHP
jgi:hypothetical protein